MTNPLFSGLDGPLAPYADTFAEHLLGQGYAPWTVQDKLYVVARLSHWLRRAPTPCRSPR